MKPLPIFGTGIKANSEFVTAQRRLNCFFDIRQDGDRTNIIIRGTPGAKTPWVTLPDSPIRGWWALNSYLYVVAGSSVYAVDTSGTANLLGSIINSGQLVQMGDDSITMLIVDGAQAYSVLLPLGAPTLVADANFPNGAQSIAQLDSKMYAPFPNSRRFAASGTLNATVWTPGIVGTKENASDNLVAVDVWNGALILWGSDNMEFWQDVGSSPLPVQRINGASQAWGLAALRSRVALANTMYFLGKNRQGGVQVFRLNGYTPQRVSNTDLEDLFATFGSYSDAIALTYTVSGHPMYQITFPGESRSFLFDTQTEMWYETQTGIANIARHFGNLGVTFNFKNYICDTSSGNIYELDDDTYTDNGTTIKRQIASRHIRMDGNEFGVSELTLEMETGVGTATGQGADPQIMMQVSRDGGKTYGVERWKQIGAVGQYRRRVNYSQMGSARDFVFQFTMTDPVKFVVTGANATLSPGAEAGQ